MIYIYIYKYTCCSCLLIIMVSYPALALRFVSEAADKMKKATFVCRPQWLFIFASFVTRAFGTSPRQSFLSWFQTPNVPPSLAGAAPLVPWRWRPGTLAAKFWSLQCGVHGWKNKARQYIYIYIYIVQEGESERERETYLYSIYEYMTAFFRLIRT